MVRTFVTSVLTDLELAPGHDLCALFQDGTVLCRLINTLFPNAIRDVHTTPSTEQEARANIEAYLAFCRSYAFKAGCMFEPEHLQQSQSQTVCWRMALACALIESLLDM
jgi:hypothetical protein